MSTVLVTGTDTGVGKTLVSAAIAAALAGRGVRLGVAKPCETGCRLVDGALYPEDAVTLAAAARTTDPIESVSPYRLRDPLAPALAAARAGVTIDVAALARALRARAETLDLLLVEGAGGLLVPLADGTSFADLAREIGASVLLVVGSRLGAINHALLTLGILARRRIPLLGYVVNRLAADDDLAVATNTPLLRSLTEVRCLGEIPYLADAAALLARLHAGEADAVVARRALVELAEAHLDLGAITVG